MQLTKKQVTYIDDYLKHHKLKYWDIRIELLDHIVTKTEVLMEEGLSFDKALEEVHVGFGNHLRKNDYSRNENAVFTNGDGYATLLIEKRNNLHSKYRQLIWREIKKSFLSLNSFLILTGLFGSLFVLSGEVTHNIFITVALILSVIPMCYFIIRGFLKTSIYKLKKTLNINIAANSILIVYIFSNFSLQLSPSNLALLSETQFEVFMTSIVAFNFLYTLSVLKVYNKTVDYYFAIHQKLQQL